MMGNRRIYLLFSGEYSDRRVIGAYTTEDAAYAAMDAEARRGEWRTGYDTYDVEQIDLDPDTPVFVSDRERVYDVSFDVNGEVAWVMIDRDTATPNQPVTSYGADRGVRVHVRARSHKHAIKSAAEIRAAYLARREGIDA